MSFNKNELFLKKSKFSEMYMQECAAITRSSMSWSSSYEVKTTINMTHYFIILRTVTRIFDPISSFFKVSDSAVTANFVAGYTLNAANPGGGTMCPSTLLTVLNLKIKTAKAVHLFKTNNIIPIDIDNVSFLLIFLHQFYSLF